MSLFVIILETLFWLATYKANKTVLSSAWSLTSSHLLWPDALLKTVFGKGPTLFWLPAGSEPLDLRGISGCVQAGWAAREVFWCANHTPFWRIYLWSCLLLPFQRSEAKSLWRECLSAQAEAQSLIHCSLQEPSVVGSRRKNPALGILPGAPHLPASLNPLWG